MAPDTVTTRGPNEPAVKDDIENRQYMFTNVTFQVGRLLLLTHSALLKRRGKVEGELFRVPRYYFEEASPVFRDMFQLPVAEGVVPDGVGDEQPLFLHGVDREDFQQLLRVMFPR